MKLIPAFTAVFLCLTIPCFSKAPEKDFSTRDVRQAIDMAVHYLLDNQNTDDDDVNKGSWIKPGDTNGESSSVFAKFRTGETAMITYALLESGMSPENERIAMALDWLIRKKKESHQLQKKYISIFNRVGKLKKTGDTYRQLTEMEQKAFDQTYNIAFRALALSAAVRKGGDKYRDDLEQDVRTLSGNSIDGAYGYTCTGKNLAISKARKRASTITVKQLGQLSELYVDASNSQYGLYGVWAGRQAGIPVHRDYWKQVTVYWKASQNSDGGWGYTTPPRPKTTASRRGSHPTMTAAAIASLFVAMDEGGGNGTTVHLDRAFQWFEDHFAVSMDPEKSSAPAGEDKDSPCFHLSYYYLYCVERVALACGYKHFGGVDWYRAGTEYILSKQYKTGKKWKGSWSGKWVDGYRNGATAYSLLFLVRGLRPVLFNKLKHGGNWNHRPRDMAGLSRWLGKQCETEINWQIVDVKSPPETWHDAPILYISGTKDPGFDKQDLQNIQRFAYQGGTIFSCPSGPDTGFSQAMRKVYKKLFPDCRNLQTSEKHPIYSIHYQIGKSVKLEVAFNGIRPIAIHSTRDLPLRWQAPDETDKSEDFKLAMNLYRFITDRASPRQRGQSTWPAKVKCGRRKSLKILRVVHGGNDDPEPLALEALANRMSECGLPVRTLKPAAPEKLAGCGADIAFITGTDKLELTDKQGAALKDFVRGRGTIIIDAAGGNKEFFESACGEMEKVFGKGKVADLPHDHAILEMKDYEIRSVRTRNRGAEPVKPPLSVVTYSRRPAVFISRMDLTAGLVGYRMFGINGLIPDDAFRICRNIALYVDQKRK